ncbi:ubiquitin carboxyl-terminal hydrolase 47 isoform X2 [Photinus pyralis]|nr:ubiquitin carboxyl-terminal hydrolase 47 isoform X2 [Photinus pyralis]XP_031348563.1 ubiquitin carboxyl-terminal hydrolase 47 isoform X2 [Photinus pyralis]XP_031348564.1 ubiquitin carboxyl-terminal hydrolase 47 isoform X2 [Photinus pyralis]
MNIKSLQEGIPPIVERAIEASIKDTIGEGPKRQSIIKLTPSKTVASVFTDVGYDFHYSPDKFELIIQNHKTGDTIILNQYKDKTLGEIGVVFEEGVRNCLIISALKNQKNMTLVVNDATDDDLLLGASASPTTGELPSSSTEHPPALMSIDYPDYNPYILNFRSARESFNYVGLVNQAMTCYLNSLLQALYMTPEFRNALYKWEFDGHVEAKSIPFQLQRLFLNLQTSTKSAVETTELTKSFGWDLSEAWQQHDIQELCRVMFDALEQKFKDTEQANLINDLYEGKMLDYVKCLECSTEKSREDTFLDIPLPVRPFGSNVAYNSVEEALRAFVQPETLDGNNQYHCEKCNKKCDAHKGLKFIKFPYLLTLHLKRFDFDYSSMHRIKLNDKVVFPEILNLNSFVPTADYVIEHETIEETIVKCDDCSTTDSGSALDDESCQYNEVSSTVNGLDDNCQDDDEGIDMSSGNHHENEKNRREEAKGPYMYELFSIMIHSGSATGGHYYAYIKDFQKNQWLCFNDQTVSRITEDDIHKTYGGGPTRGYYSSVYSSSTNAYMLMYRQIDKQRNCHVMAVDEFPLHIKNLLQQMREKEENDRATRERESDMFKLKVYCYHPTQHMLLDTKLFVFNESYLSEAVADAHHRFKLEGVAVEDCRLVIYNKHQEYIDCSFEGENLKFCDITYNVSIYHVDWLLEIKQPGTEFQVFKSGGVNMKVCLINIETEEVEGPVNFHVNPGETVLEVKHRLAKMFNMDIDTIKLVQEMYCNEPHYLEDDNAMMRFDPSCNDYKLYVSNALDEDLDKPFVISKLNKIIDRYVHIVTIYVTYPDTETVSLESLSIPPLDLNQNLDKNEFSSTYRLRTSPQPVCEAFGDHSNSEDSSLSDSDRTLVGDAPGECLALLSSHSNSPVDQHMASPSDPAEDTYNHEVFRLSSEEMNWAEVQDSSRPSRVPNYFFKGTILPTLNSDSFSDMEQTRLCRVQVDKRMNLAKLKKHLEPFVGVSMEYFKVYRQYPHDIEWSRLTDSLGRVKDGDKIAIKLGRVLRKDEHLGKIFHLTPENSESFTFLFEWVIAKGQTVGQVKKEILFAAKKQHMLDIAFNKSRLRVKNWKNPCKVYLDDQKFGDDINLTSNFEIFLQDLGEGETVTNSNQICLFVKRWCPSTLMLTPFHEVVLDVPTLDELKNTLSKEFDIPKRYVEVANLKGSFPCDINVLDIHNDAGWILNNSDSEDWAAYSMYQDGSVFLYKDSREPLKELTPEERKEIHQRENIRLGKFSTKTHSPRRERALKIYLDTPPGKSDEGFGD